jgi:hypothetical protein
MVAVHIGLEAAEPAKRSQRRRRVTLVEHRFPENSNVVPVATTDLLPAAQMVELGRRSDPKVTTRLRPLLSTQKTSAEVQIGQVQPTCFAKRRPVQ